MNCPYCQKPISRYVGQVLDYGKLVWYASYACAQCGRTVEEDGNGVPPPDIRDQLLTENGHWCLGIYPSTPHKRIKCLQIFKNALALSVKDTALIRDSLPGIVCFGTKTEMAWLALLLSNNEIDVRVEPILDEIRGLDFMSIWNQDV